MHEGQSENKFAMLFWGYFIFNSKKEEFRNNFVSVEPACSFANSNYEITRYIDSQIGLFNYGNIYNVNLSYT